MTVPRTESGRDGVASDALKVATLTLAVALLALSLAGVVGTATAIDQVAILSPDRSTIEATPGETLEIDVTLQSQGGHGGEGVANVSLIAQYHPEYLDVTEIERGPWLEGDDTAVRTATAVADERGTAIIEQRREPAAGGTTGRGTITTLTVRVAADAPAGSTPISFEESDVALTGDYPAAVFDEPVTVSIDGSDDPLPSFDHPDPEEGPLEPTDSAAKDVSDDGTAGGSEPSTGGTAGLALVAVSIVVGALWLTRPGRRR